MKKFTGLFILSAVSAFCFFGFAQDPNWRIIETEYPTEDYGVSSYIVTEHGADSTGIANCAAVFQQLLNKLGTEGGGVLFVPKGKYLIQSPLVVPTGVTLRGEWKRPVKGEPIEGTVLMCDVGMGQLEGAFITMNPSTAVTNLSIWYPRQDPNSVKNYPPSILYGNKDVWGNDYCNVRYVTLVNSHSGIVLSRYNGGGCPNIFEVYGSPLHRGIEIDNIADVGRFDWIHFSPDYWSGSGLPNSPAKGGAHATYMRKNGTGIVMRRNDWSYTCHAEIEGYKYGFLAGHSIASAGSQPNGHNYGFTLKNCQTGIYCEEVSGAGIMFTRVNMTDCDNGIVVAASMGSTVQLYNCDISANNYAVLMEKNVGGKLMTQQCNFLRGKILAQGGLFTASDCVFENAAPQVSISPSARTILTGNHFSGEPQIDNRSMFVCAVDHTPVTVPALPEFPDIRPQETKPARKAMYNVLAFGAVADATVTDNTGAIQAALNKAAADGGGIVFMPPGKYRVNGNLTVPSGVELKGASDLATVPRAQGAILEVYAGKNDPNGTPFMKLSERSGIRGLTIDYPEQLSSLLPNIYEYPYCIQGTGKDIYIVNVGLRATYRGVDFFTYKCDNHYVDYLAGHTFKNAIRVGGGSENGKLCNMQFNTIVYSNGDETKFGSWPNSIKGFGQAAYDYNYKELEFMILGDCKNQILYNDFHFGSRRGQVFTADNGIAAQGIGLGLGIDASVKALSYEALDPAGFDLINSQIVSVQRDVVDPQTSFIETTASFTGEANLFASDYWGSANNGVMLAGGTLNLILPHFSASGRNVFANMADARLSIHNGDITSPARFVTSGKESAVSVESSVTNPTLATVGNFTLWKNNLNSSPALLGNIETLSRTGWTASASHNSGNARNAIDGNAASRWDTGGPQANGQVYLLDMKTQNTFNTIILDNAGSPSDGPAGYSVSVSTDGSEWTEVDAGKASGSVTVITFGTVTARYIKIVQTGSKGNYWSIHELYVLEGEEDGVYSAETASISIFSAGKTIYFKHAEETETLTVELYGMTGQKLFSRNITQNYMDTDMPAGIYIVSVRNGSKTARAKVIIR